MTFGLIGCQANTGHITLVNDSGEEIAQARLEVCGQTLDFNEISPAGEQSASYRVKADSTYHLYIKFSSGKELEKTLGYVTNGFDFDDKLVVKNSDIVLQRGPPK
jgi:hypothetical protein